MKPFLMRISFACLLFLSLWPGEGVARESDGTLGLIRLPNNGIPTITTPGGAFYAELIARSSLSLSNGTTSWPLSATWTQRPGDVQQARCVVPQDIPPGEYSFCAENDATQDTNIRSVYVLEAMPEEYVIAHITDTHIGTTRHPRAATAIIAEVVAAVNASEAAFALITGDLTENGQEEQFRQFLEVLDRCAVPTYVVPGNHDRMGRNYERFFGPLCYAFTFGQDGYLGFDTKDFIIADDAGPQDGMLHYYRRQQRASRWSIGFTHRYDPTMGMRAQMTLFVDDPLDLLLYGHYHREPGENDGIPWGRTAIIMTPAAINGQIRFVGVNAQGLHPGETVQAASIRETQE